MKPSLKTSIGVTNLSEPVLASLQADLATVWARCPARPSVPTRVHVVALERGGYPEGLPRHRVAKPAASAPASFAGRCGWETCRQSFQMVRDGGDLWVIGGGEEGALAGFGEALERLTGVIWDNVTEKDLLFGPPRPLPVGVQTPGFPFRFRDGPGPETSEGTAEFLTWLSRTRFNGRVFSSKAWARKTPEQRAEIVRQLRARCMHLVVGYHAMDHFLPNEEFARHPEWFGMRDGRRVLRAVVELPDCPHLRPEIPIQPCYSNPELIAYLTDRMAAQVRECPEIEIFSIWPHDGINNWCQCPACLKKTPYEHMYTLALALARKTPHTLPIELIVYANMLTVPRRPLARSDRIVSMLCPYLRSYHHRFYEPGGPPLVIGTLYPAPDRANPVDDRDYGKLFRRWSRVWQAAGTVPGIFDYGGILWMDETRRFERQRFMYHPSVALRFDEARWYQRHGVRYTYLCALFDAWPDTLHHLAIPRALWDPTASPGAFVRHYYRAMAGRHAVPLQRALSAVEARLSADVSPLAALARLERVLACRPVAPAALRRYRIWARYVRLAWASHEAERSGDLGAALGCERRVLAFLERHVEALRDVAITRRLLGYSSAKQQRFVEWQKAQHATDYRL